MSGATLRYCCRAVCALRTAPRERPLSCPLQAVNYAVAYVTMGAEERLTEVGHLKIPQYVLSYDQCKFKGVPTYIVNFRRWQVVTDVRWGAQNHAVPPVKLFQNERVHVLVMMYQLMASPNTSHAKLNSHERSDRSLPLGLCHRMRE